MSKHGIRVWGDQALIHQLLRLRRGPQHLRNETIISGAVGLSEQRVQRDRATAQSGPGHLGLGIWSCGPTLAGPHRISTAGEPEKRFTSLLITRKGLMVEGVLELVEAPGLRAVTLLWGRRSTATR